MPGLFVTATGTDVGKTFVTAALIRAGRRAGLQMGAMKPIMTGFSEAHAALSDAAVLLGALGLPATAEALASTSPWRFSAPLAPSMAAAAEGKRVDFDGLVDACRDVLSPTRLTLIEGIGGVMVPIDADHTVLDLIEALALPVLLVTASHLGALSHCLTAFEALRQRGCTPSLIALNESPFSTVPFEETRSTLAAFCTGAAIVPIPRNADARSEDILLRATLSIVPPPSPDKRTKA